MPLEFKRSWGDEEVERFRDSWVRVSKARWCTTRWRSAPARVCRARVVAAGRRTRLAVRRHPRNGAAPAALSATINRISVRSAWSLHHSDTPELSPGNAICNRAEVEGMCKLLHTGDVFWPSSGDPPPRGTDRCYGAGGGDMATSSLHQSMECRDAPAERFEQVPRAPGPR
jgi:hypothetical protein